MWKRHKRECSFQCVSMASTLGAVSVLANSRATIFAQMGRNVASASSYFVFASANYRRYVYPYYAYAGGM